MNTISFPLYKVADIRKYEQQLFAAGIEPLVLMQQAGYAAYQHLRKHWPRARRIVVYCGSGNNGGDGYVLAQLAQQQQLTVTIIYVGELTALSFPAVEAMRACVVAGIELMPLLKASRPEADVIVDALLGIGLDRAPQGEYADAIAAINQSGLPVLALDVPSGVNADCGYVYTIAVQALYTITFLTYKRGLFTAQAPAYCGQITLACLDVPVIDFTPAAYTLAYSSSTLPSRKLDAHKGDYGHVLVIGGNHGMGGAMRLAAEAAARCGAGLITVATRPAHVSALLEARPELMCYGIEQADELLPLLQRATVVLLGMGLGQDSWAQALYALALASGLPKVIDADALNLLAQQPVELNNAILTPHPGEAARLLSKPTSTVQAQRFAAAEELQRRYQAVIVLKGAGTIVQTHATTAVCQAANPAMASGGMGDVLGGVIAAGIAQGLSLREAAEWGVAIHASAANYAGREGVRGLLASDLFPHLRRLCG